ncbi:MAG TPA: SCO family protein [Burkholderiaceae bacterium]
MTPGRLSALWLAGAIGATGSQALALPALDTDAALRASQAAVSRQLAEHTLLDAQGQPVRLSSYRGKPLLVSFIYTGCFQVCPTTTRSLSLAVDAMTGLFGADKFNVVSIGFNQPFDSPQAMRTFARQMRIDAPNWHFLSPPPAGVDALTRDFGFSYVATPAGFDHVLTVSVVDPQGKVYQQVYGERLSADMLGEPLRRLLRDNPLPADTTLDALVRRVRLVCTVYDAKTGTYRTDYGLLFEVAGGVTFALAMLWFFVGEWRAQRRARRATAAVRPAPPAPPAPLTS